MSALSRALLKMLFDALGGDRTAEHCRQRGTAPCAAACPEEAIRCDAEVRAWLVDEESCTGSGERVEPCPFDAMRMDNVTGKALKCDSRLGAMRCVEIRPVSAISVRGRKAEVSDGE